MIKLSDNDIIIRNVKSSSKNLFVEYGIRRVWNRFISVVTIYIVKKFGIQFYTDILTRFWIVLWIDMFRYCDKTDEFIPGRKVSSILHI